MPEVRIGALAGAGGVQKLYRLVGRGKALEWILLGSHVTATEALSHGLVTAVHLAVDLMPAAMELAGRFRLLGPRAACRKAVSLPPLVPLPIVDATVPRSSACPSCPSWSAP